MMTNRWIDSNCGSLLYLLYKVGINSRRHDEDSNYLIFSNKIDGGIYVIFKGAFIKVADEATPQSSS